MAPDLNVPNVFTSGTSIVAADMNANFDAIEAKINTTGVHVYEAASIETAALENNAVTHAKMDSKTLNQQVANGFVQKTTDTTGITTGTNIISITITGDGVTPIRIEGNFIGMAVGGTGDVIAYIRDGSTNMTGDVVSVVSGGRATLRPVDYLAAFSGSKTIHLHGAFVAGSGTSMTASATTASPARLRATWAPGHSTS